jgi:putative membrane protein (TIGR04086 family)
VLNKDIQEKFYITYIKAVSRGLILSLVLVLVVAALFYFSNLSFDFIDTATWIITITSICYSSIYGAYKIGRKGYLHGALIGAIYLIIVAIIAFLAEKGKLDMGGYLVAFIMSLVIGALSGMIGIVISNRD